jgi:hypothetical protein
MASTFTTNKNIEKPAHNDYVDDWDIPVNSNSNIIDACFGNVTTINMTGLSTHSFVAADLQAQTIKFTGTLNSGAIPIKLTNGVSGTFTVVDATTPTDSTSCLNMSWASGGTSYAIPQGITQLMRADGGSLIWAPDASPAVGVPITVTLPGSPSNPIALLQQQVGTGLVIIAGVAPNGTCGYAPPSGFKGQLNIIGTFSNGAGSPVVAMFPSGGGSGVQFSPGHNYIIEVVDNTHIYLMASN